MEHVTISSGGLNRERRARRLPRSLHPHDQAWGSHRGNHLCLSPVHGDLACPWQSGESGMTHEEDRLVLRHSGSSNGRKGQSGHKGTLVEQEERLLGLFTCSSRAKSRENAVFQGFCHHQRGRGIRPLTCCFLTPSAPAPAEGGTSPRVLNGKCCQLNPNAVSRAFIKMTYQVRTKPTRILLSNAVSPPIAPKSLLTPLCPALVLHVLITSILLMAWHHCCMLLSSGH